MDETHHAVIGEECDGDEHEEAGEVSGALEAVGKAEDAGAYDGDEDVCEGLEVRGEWWGPGEERGILARVRWERVG